MRFFITRSLLALSLMTSLLAAPTFAACPNTALPGSWVYTEYYPDGRGLIQIATWDTDNYNQMAAGVVVYNTSGRIIPSTIVGLGFFSAVKPAGVHWYAILKDSNACSQFVRWINGPRF